MVDEFFTVTFFVLLSEKSWRVNSYCSVSQYLRMIIFYYEIFNRHVFIFITNIVVRLIWPYHNMITIKRQPYKNRIDDRYPCPWLLTFLDKNTPYVIIIILSLCTTHTINRSKIIGAFRVL